jgi:hypothetical protein
LIILIIHHLPRDNEIGIEDGKDGIGIGRETPSSMITLRPSSSCPRIPGSMTSNC